LVAIQGIPPIGTDTRGVSAEFFNLTNHPNFAQPGSLNFTAPASFAKIAATRDSPNDPRQILFALKFYF
jgi:hypothetical protein